MSKKREQLIQTAIRLFADDGVGVATARIAKEAGVSNGTLFNHFQTKQVLIDSVYVYIKTIMADEVLSNLDMDQSLHDFFLNVWLSYARWCRKHALEKTALELLRTSQLLTNAVKEQGHSTWHVIAEKIIKGIEQKKLVQAPPEIIFLASEGMLNSVMDYATTNKLSSKNLDITIAQSFEILWRGISTDYKTKEK